MTLGNSGKSEGQLGGNRIFCQFDVEKILFGIV